MTETEMMEVLHVILETICVLISRIFFQILLSMFFFEILKPKVKPIEIGIFYRPLNASDFSDIFSNDLQQIDNNTNETYLLGDFNINFLQNGKYILKENQSYELKNSISALVNKSFHWLRLLKNLLQ